MTWTLSGAIWGTRALLNSAESTVAVSLTRGGDTNAQLSRRLDQLLETPAANWVASSAERSPTGSATTSLRPSHERSNEAPEPVRAPRADDRRQARRKPTARASIASLAIRFQVDSGHERVAEQEGQHVVAVHPLGRWGIDLNAIPEVENAFRTFAEPDQRVEGREQGARIDPACTPRRRPQVRGRVPSADDDRFSSPASTSSATRRLESARGSRK